MALECTTTVTAAAASDSGKRTDFNVASETVGVLVDTTRCVGCRTCEAACYDANREAGLSYEEAVDFAGKYFKAEKLALSLKPVRKPRPPMWYGGSVAKAVERAAQMADTRLGDSWVASSHLTEAVITEQAGVFHKSLAALGKPMPAEQPRHPREPLPLFPDLEKAAAAAGQGG